MDEEKFRTHSHCPYCGDVVLLYDHCLCSRSKAAEASGAPLPDTFHGVPISFDPCLGMKAEIDRLQSLSDARFIEITRLNKILIDRPSREPEPPEDDGEAYGMAYWLELPERKTGNFCVLCGHLFNVGDAARCQGGQMWAHERCAEKANPKPRSSGSPSQG